MRMKAIVAVVCLFGLSAGGWFGYQKFVAASPADEFIVAPLQRGDIVRTVSATGTIEPLVKTIVGSQVSGNIKKWHTDFNQEIKAGEVLAEIDPARFRTAFNRAQADLALARAREEEMLARYKDAERERKRLARLHEQQTASEQELELAITEEEATRAAWHGAQASVAAAEAALNAAKVDLEWTIIRSPIDGVVIARNIEDGQTVAASLQAPELFIIANNLRRMQVNANVSEADIGLIREGMSASFTVDAYPNRSFEGTISQIRFNATAVDGVVTYVTLIEVENDDLALRPGMTANVTFIVATAENVLRVPNAALRFTPVTPDAAGGAKIERSRKPAVHLLVKGRPVRREIDVGLSDGSWSELMAGDLKEGDPIITDRNWRAAGRPRPRTTF